MGRKTKGNLAAASAQEAKRIIDLLDKAIVRYDGTFEEIEQAVGFYMIGRHVGWKPLILVHNKRTIRKYEEILGIEIRKEFDEEGPDVGRAFAYQIARKLSNFWKVVSGDVKIEGRRLLQ
ncbi:MAG: hypothetical protein R3F45_02180 [Gammaproteobacteria bacterium]